MTTTRTIDKRRLGIVAVCWAVSLPGLAFSTTFFLGTVQSLLGSRPGSGGVELTIGALLLPVAWAALLRMCFAWVTRTSISLWSANVGMLVGLYCGATTMPAVLFVLPCSALAAYLWLKRWMSA